MELSAPTKIVFGIASVLALVSVLPLVGIPLAFVAANQFWILLAAFVLLAAGNVFNGL